MHHSDAFSVTNKTCVPFYHDKGDTIYAFLGMVRKFKVKYSYALFQHGTKILQVSNKHTKAFSCVFYEHSEIEYPSVVMSYDINPVHHSGMVGKPRLLVNSSYKRDTLRAGRI